MFLDLYHNQVGSISYTTENVYSVDNPLCQSFSRKFTSPLLSMITVVVVLVPYLSPT